MLFIRPHKYDNEVANTKLSTKVPADSALEAEPTTSVNYF